MSKNTYVLIIMCSSPVIFIRENNLYLNKINTLLHTYKYIHNESTIYFQSVPE